MFSLAKRGTLLGLRTSAAIWTSFNSNETWHIHYRMIGLHRSYNGLLVQELALGKKMPIEMFEYIGPHLNLEKLKNLYSLFLAKRGTLLSLRTCASILIPFNLI